MRLPERRLLDHAAMRFGIAAALFLATAFCARAAEQKAETLFDFEGGFDLASVETRDAKIALDKTKRGSALRVATGHTQPWPGIVLKPKEGQWDLSAYRAVFVDVRNTGKNAVQVGCRVDDAVNAGSTKPAAQRSISLEPGASGAIEVPLPPKMPGGQKAEFFGMRGTPLSPRSGGGGEGAGGGAMDTAKIVRITVFVAHPTEDHQFEIDNVRASGASEVSLAKGDFFPFIDEYGQYIHRDWPGKLHGAADFAQRREAEARDLAANPGPADWDKYGGWKDGPTLKATGFFRTEKHEGKWFLVDPDGKLFFSHGVDCVGSQDATPIDDREKWFRNLPAQDGEFKSFFTNQASRRFYYAGKKPLCFDFAAADLMRKYGAEWQREHGALAHQRLRSWGINTIGNWSNGDVCLMRRTPYTVAISYSCRKLAASTGHWKDFPDVFDPDFKDKLRKRMESERGKSAGDLWCLGYFVDNELPWGNETSLALTTLQAPPDQAAKKVFVDDLKAKYGDVGKLNAAWGTAHASWDALLQNTKPRAREKAQADLAAFAAKTAEQFFKTCRDAVKEVAPDNLYLGCRFSSSNPAVAAAAAKYCDVVSYNLYRTPEQLAKWQPSSNDDVPIVIGEFHFGALDRGMFHTGLRAVKNQDERAKAYTDYVGVALKNSQFVGCHWFKYRDESTTGRPSDGENYQIGLVDVADTPYPETIAATREMGRELYKTRLKSLAP